jgi:GNAT superfamily N-acetyltransferase
VKRNAISEDGWTLETIDDFSICDKFDCGEKDLNEYFHKDVRAHRKALLTRTYCLYESSTPNIILALLDFCNDAIHLEKPHIPFDMSDRTYPTYPAVKLTRFGVAKQFQHQNIGTHALNMVKKFFITDNRTGCRFITVDAYSQPEIISFYGKNGFAPYPKKIRKHSETTPLFYSLKPLSDALE